MKTQTEIEGSSETSPWKNTNLNITNELSRNFGREYFDIIILLLELMD